MLSYTLFFVSFKDIFLLCLVADIRKIYIEVFDLNCFYIIKIEVFQVCRLSHGAGFSRLSIFLSYGDKKKRLKPLLKHF